MITLAHKSTGHIYLTLLTVKSVQLESALYCVVRGHVDFFLAGRDIIRGSQDVKWESIKGLETAKRLLKEAVVMPIKYPKYVKNNDAKLSEINLHVLYPIVFPWYLEGWN